jgi:S-phase kinase-associated protein 1
MGGTQKGQKRHEIRMWRCAPEGRCLLLIGRGSISVSSSLPPSKHTMVLLVTSDNEQFVVEKDVAERSVLIKNMLEGDSFPFILLLRDPNARLTDVGESDQPIPLPNVSSSVLKKASIFGVRGCLFHHCLAHTGTRILRASPGRATPDHRRRVTR